MNATPAPTTAPTEHGTPDRRTWTGPEHARWWSLSDKCVRFEILTRRKLLLGRAVRYGVGPVALALGVYLAPYVGR